MSKTQLILKIHLIISICIVLPVAFVYGFNPGLCFDIDLKTTDAQNAFKAFMGVYLGFAGLWSLGILQSKYLRVALVSHVVFMLGLGFGRLLSLLWDGTPSMLFVLGTFGELILGGYGLWVCVWYKRY
jgi:hypothetical protein